MKNDFNHIDEVFKNSFENFEANVDPTVWTNVQQNIGGGAAPAPQHAVGGSASTVSKSLLFYATASIVATATIIGSVYLLNSTPEEKEIVKKEVVKITPTNEDVIDLSPIDETTNKLEETNIVAVDEVVLNESTEKRQIVEEDVVSGEHDEEEFISSTEKLITEEVDNTNSETIPLNNTNPESSSSALTVTEAAELNISINANVKKGKAPLDVEFGVNGNGVSYLWDFGDNSSISSEESPYHTFREPGTYKVKLTSIDKEANSITRYQVIVVEKNITSHLEEVRNVFSPNGDGINDVIKIEGKNITKFHAVIMNSKGNLIYEWDSIDGFWDGRDNNNDVVPKGAYYIAVTATGEDGKTHTAKKRIQLY